MFFMVRDGKTRAKHPGGQFSWDALYVRVLAVFGILIAVYIMFMDLPYGVGVMSLIPAAVTLVISFFFMRTHTADAVKRSDVLPVRELLVISACWLLAGSVYILNARLLPGSDPKEITEIAETLLRGDL